MDPTKIPIDILSKIPALPPPPGVQSNFINPYSISQNLVVASAICLTLMGVSVMIRFYTKIFIKHVWGRDDYTCILAMIGTIGFTATSIAIVQKGFGPHQWNVPVSTFTSDLIRCLLVVDVVYSPSILMAKLSLLLLYLEVFHPNVRLRYFIFIGIVFNTLFYLSLMTAFFIIYMPRKGETLFQVLYSPRVHYGVTLAIVQGAVNVGSDLYILCLPIPGIWQLQLPLGKKIGISAIFLTGLLAFLASITGLYYRTRVHSKDDVTFDLVPVLIWVIVELNVGVICSCLPSFLGFFRHHLPQFQSIISLIGSKMKVLSFSKLSSQPSSSSSGNSNRNRLQTKDIKVTLGSQVDGEGRFLNLRSGLSRVENWSDWEKVSEHVFPGPDETRRGYYEHGEYGTSQGHRPYRGRAPCIRRLSPHGERGLREQGISGKSEGIILVKFMTATVRWRK